MALQNTNLLIQASKLPATFKGKPQDLFDTMIRRMKIVSPTGTNFIFIGDTEPTSNVGPWLRDGTKWYVFDDDTKRYVPLDISDSETVWYQIGKNAPSSAVPPVWLRTTKDPTDSDPSVGVPIGWYLHNGTNWESFVGVVPSGPTTSRPANPIAFQQFYDSTISVLIWFERNAWRTVSGVPGDVKAVAYETLTEALTVNPGWDVLGAANQAMRGRILLQATKDPGATPETVLTVGAGVTPRAAFEIFGGDQGIEPDNTAPTIFVPAQMALWHLVKL